MTIDSDTSPEAPLDPTKFQLLSEEPGPDERNVPQVDVDRVFADHHLDEGLRPLIKEQLDSLSAFVVPSGSKYKARVIQQILRQLCPDKEIPVIIVKAPSQVSDNPVGKETVEGAEKRMAGAQAMINAIRQGQSSGNNQIDALLRTGTVGIVGSIENGLRKKALVDTPLEDETKEFDRESGYADVAYIIIDLLGRGRVQQVSPASEAVLFPQEDVIAAFDAQGSFRHNTVGQFMQRRLRDAGIEIDHQDPQAYLTQKEVDARTRDKVLPRSQQLATVVVKGLAELASQSASSGTV